MNKKLSCFYFYFTAHHFTLVFLSVHGLDKSSLLAFPICGLLSSASCDSTFSTSSSLFIFSRAFAYYNWHFFISHPPFTSHVHFSWNFSLEHYIWFSYTHFFLQLICTSLFMHINIIHPVEHPISFFLAFAHPLHLQPQDVILCKHFTVCISLGDNAFVACRGVKAPIFANTIMPLNPYPIHYC